MFKKISALTLVAATLATSSFAMAKESLIERINQKGVITVGTEGTYAPFTYHDESGKLTGYDVEVTRAVAEKLGVKVEFKETNWDSMLAGLKAERFDLVANQVALTTPERQATFDKSEAYNWSGAVLAAPKESKITAPEQVKGLRAAQSLTSNYGELAKKYEAVLVPVDGLAQSIKVIETKRADVTYVLAEDYHQDYLKKNPKADLAIVWQSADKVGAGLVANKGNQEALAKIDAAIVELQKDGTLKKLGEQFFGQDVSVK